MNVLLIIAAWVAASVTIGAAWVGACAFFDVRAARRNRRGGYIR